jgi:predicted transcriptional regulator of viral defense system
MRWEELLRKVGHLPLIEGETLLVGSTQPSALRVQLNRWQKQGKLVQLKRGFYVLATPYFKGSLYEPYVAARLSSPSYLSLEWALHYHDLIPESVPVWTSVTTKRAGRWVTPLGTFDYRHIQPSLFWGYDSLTVAHQTAFVSTPEKALLDFFYLRPMEVSMDYLTELRLQNVEKILVSKLWEYAKRFGKPRILQATEMIVQYIHSYQEGETLL